MHQVGDQTKVKNHLLPLCLNFCVLVFRGEFYLNNGLKRRSERGWLQMCCSARYVKLDTANVDAPLNLHSATFVGDMLNCSDCAPVHFMQNIVRHLQCP